MKWLELSIQTTPELVEPLSELFLRHGEGGVVVQEEGNWDPDDCPGELGPPTSVAVRTYLPLDATTHSRREMIDVGVRLVSLLQPMARLQERVLEEEEWEAAWKAHFTLLRVGKRLVIKPTWQEYAPEPRKLVIELDPGMAFGTGHHPTTCMCLEALEGHVDPGMKVLDLGTGSGILAIASAKLGAGDVLALDTDMVAVDAAQANCRQNRVDRRIQTFQGSLPYPLVAPKTFDLAVANITAKAIISVADHLADALVTGGTLITSGILRERQQEVEEALAKRFELGNRLYDGDWVALMAHRQ